MSTGAHVEMVECFYLASVGAGGRLVLIMRNINMNVLTLKSNDQISKQNRHYIVVDLQC